MIPGVNIGGKASTASVNRAGGSALERDEVGRRGCSETLGRNFRGQSPLRKLLGSNKNLDWLKTDLNAAKIITAQDYKHTKN